MFADAPSLPPRLQTVVIPGFGRFGRSPSGAPGFALNEAFAARHGIASRRPVLVVGERQAVEMRFVELSMACGVPRDTARIAFKELCVALGDAVGRRREAVRLQVPGLGVLVGDAGTLQFAPLKGGRAKGERGGERGATARSGGRGSPTPRTGRSTARSRGLAASVSAPALPLALDGIGTKASSRRGPETGSRRTGRQFSSRTTAEEVRLGLRTPGGTRKSRAQLEATLARPAVGKPRQITAAEAKADNERRAAQREIDATAEREEALREELVHLRRLKKNLDRAERGRAKGAAREREIARAQRVQAEEAAARRKVEHRELYAQPDEEAWAFGDNEELAAREVEKRAAQREGLAKQIEADAHTKELTARRRAAKRREKMKRERAVEAAATGKPLPAALKGAPGSVAGGVDAAFADTTGSKPDYPVFMRTTLPAQRSRGVPEDAAARAYSEAFERQQRAAAELAEAERRKAKEIRDAAREQERQYRKKKADARRLQQEMNASLKEQAAANAQRREAERRAKLCEPLGDPSGIHPVEKRRDYTTENEAKAVLRRQLAAQVEAKKKAARRARGRDIRQDRFFLDGVLEQQKAERREKLARREAALEELHGEWQRQEAMTKVLEKARL